MYVTVCPESLERRGGDDVRTCTGDGGSPVGQWNGIAPVCLSKIVFLSIPFINDGSYFLFGLYII